MKDLEISDSNDTSNDINLDYIISLTKDKILLPKFIKLQNTAFRESKWIRKRTLPAVLRYHKGNKDKDYERWMLKELMLYTSYRAEDLHEYETRTAELYMEKETLITFVKSQVMEHLESVEEARYMVEQSTKKKIFFLIYIKQSTKEVNLSEIGHEICGAFE